MQKNTGQTLGMTCAFHVYLDSLAYVVDEIIHDESNDNEVPILSLLSTQAMCSCGR